VPSARVRAAAVRLRPPCRGHRGAGRWRSLAADRGRGRGELNACMDPEREDTARWLEEGRELLGMLHDEVEHLAQENEWLRAELGRLDQLQAVIARVNQDNDHRLRAERDELLAGFRRIADLVEELRRSRGGPRGRARRGSLSRKWRPHGHPRGRHLPDSIAVATPIAYTAVAPRPLRRSRWATRRGSCAR